MKQTEEESSVSGAAAWERQTSVVKSFSAAGCCNNPGTEGRNVEL